MSLRRKTYDVVVVGGGPGGSVAAKRCAQEGLKTLLLEKKRLPREKVCTGMIMGPWAHRIIREEFGELPPEVLTYPSHLSGHMIHVPGAEPQVIDWRTPLAWRKDLDFWMNRRAKELGVVIRDGAKVVRVEPTDGLSRVVLEKSGELEEILADFVIGADGAASSVRKSLFPEMKVKYSSPLRQCYSGALQMDRGYIHWFFPKNLPRPRFDLIHKGEVFLLEGSGLRELGPEIEGVLGPYGFESGAEPLWKDGCLMPLLHQELLSGPFTPARDNILLIGDAAGLVFPITYEGIGAALRSGVLAADAVSLALSRNRKAAGIYLDELEPFLEHLRRLYSLQRGLDQAPPKDASELAGTLKMMYEATRAVS